MNKGELDMEVTKTEFMILKFLAEHSVANQRQISEYLSLSIGTVNKCIQMFREKGLISDDYRLTRKGLSIMKPFEVKRAIIMAAGFGSRMVPVTLTTPKPMVKVNGIRIIDTLIDALLEKGINDITIVRGYLKHKFNELLPKYPMIKFIDNDAYNEANNIYSMYLVRKKLQNTYVFEGDLVLYNTAVIEKYHYSSNFLAFPVKKSDDWCFDTKDGVITSFIRGGNNTFQEVGISYWDKEDGKKLENDIKEVFNSPGGKELLWENVPLEKRKKNYAVRIKECKKNDVIEIDTFGELCEIDKTYINYSSPNINIEKTTIKNICNILHCEKSDINGIEFMKIGLTNVSFKFNVKGTNYVYRKPGTNTKKYINRKSEIYSEKVAKKLGLDKTIIHIDESGWKISRYLEHSTQIDPYDRKDQLAAMKLIKKLHKAEIVSDYDFDYIKETERFIDIFKEEKTIDFSKYRKTHNKIAELDKELNKKGYKKILCHNDYWYWNILKKENGELCVIDWEYSGNSYPASDVAYFVSSLEYSSDDYLELAKLYEGHSLSKEEKWYYYSVLAIVLWYWYVWALYKESDGMAIEDKDIWYDKAIDALEKSKKA